MTKHFDIVVNQTAKRINKTVFGKPNQRWFINLLRYFKSANPRKKFTLLTLTIEGFTIKFKKKCWVGNENDQDSLFDYRYFFLQIFQAQKTFLVII